MRAGMLLYLGALAVSTPAHAAQSVARVLRMGEGATLQRGAGHPRPLRPTDQLRLGDVLTAAAPEVTVHFYAGGQRFSRPPKARAKVAAQSLLHLAGKPPLALPPLPDDLAPRQPNAGATRGAFGGFVLRGSETAPVPAAPIGAVSEAEVTLRWTLPPPLQQSGLRVRVLSRQQRAVLLDDLLPAGTESRPIPATLLAPGADLVWSVAAGEKDDW